MMWEVRHGDCLTMLADLPADAVVVSDPPYGIGYVHSGGGKGMHKRRNSLMPIHADDEAFDPSPWLGFPGVLLWGADHFASRLPPTGTWLAWDKAVGIGPEDSFADAEFAWTTAKVKRNVCRYLWKGIACVKAGEDGGRRVHPTQKPIGLMRWCIQRLRLAPTTLIVDPYCGSGTTGVAAIQEGHRFLGIEREERYVKIARERIAAAAAQTVLPLEAA